MRLIVGVCLLILATTVFAQEEEELVEETTRTFPRSQLRPRLHRPTTSPPVQSEGVVHGEREELPTTILAAKPTKPPQRSRSKGRLIKTTAAIPSAVNNEEEPLSDFTTLPSSTTSRRSSAKSRNRNRNRNRSRSKSTTTSTTVPDAITTERSTKRRGPSRRTTTTTRTKPFSTTTVKPKSRGKTRQKNQRTRGRSSTTVNPVEKITKKSPGRTRTQGSVTKPPRRSNIRTTTLSRITTTTTLQSTLPERIPEIETVPPIPLQRNPLFPRDQMAKNEDEVVSKDIMDNKPEVISRNDGVPLQAPLSPIQPIKSTVPLETKPLRPVRPVPIEGLIDNSDSQESTEGVDMPIKSNSHLAPNKPVLSMPAFEENENIRPNIGVQGVPPKLIGPVRSQDLLNPKPIGFVERPGKQALPHPVKVLPESEHEVDDEAPADALSAKRPTDPHRQNVAVPPKPIGPVVFRPQPKKIEEIEEKFIASKLEENAKLPPRDSSPEAENARWVFNPTIRPNLVSSPDPVRSNHQHIALRDPGDSTRSRANLNTKNETPRKISPISARVTSPAPTRVSSKTTKVTPFPIRLDPGNTKAENPTKSKSQIFTAEHEKFPNPFEEDEVLVPEVEMQRSTSSFKLRTNSASTERSINRESPLKQNQRFEKTIQPEIATFTPLVSATRKTTLAVQLITEDEIRNRPVESITRPTETITRPPPQRGSDVLTTLSVGTGFPSSESLNSNSRPIQSGNTRNTPIEGFIPLRVKLQFADENESINSKDVVSPNAEVPARVPARTLVEPRDKPKLTAIEDPILVPPADIRATPERESLKRTNSQRPTTVAWSRPVVDASRKAATTERPLITAAERERSFSPPIERQELGGRTVSDSFKSPALHRSQNNADTMAAAPRQPLNTHLDEPHKPEMFQFESEGAPFQRNFESIPATDSKSPELNNFESPSFVIRKPVNFLNSPPRAATRQDQQSQREEVPVEEQIDHVPTKQMKKEKAMLNEENPQQPPPLQTAARLEADHDELKLPRNEQKMKVDSQPALRSRAELTTSPSLNEEYEEYYDEE